MGEWTDDELEGAVRAYFRMLAHQQDDEPYSKAAFRRALRASALKNRSEASIEFRMRNISAVLDAHGRDILRGYIGAENVGKEARRRIWDIVRKIDGEAPSVLKSDASSGSTKPGPRPRPPIVYFNIGWMKRYAGTAADDPTIGGHGFLTKEEHEHGAESFNFQPASGGKMQGYRPPGSGEKTDISRLGAARGDEYIDGVLAIWMAREPGSGSTRIVGWYENARIYRTAQAGDFKLDGETEYYTAVAETVDCRLLPPVARSFEIKSSRTAPGEGFGQKPTWYGAKAVDERVWRYVSTYGVRPATPKKTKGKGKPPRNHDPELRRKVERRAVEHAVSYYKSVYGADCRIDSVEAQAKGWDLEVFCTDEPLLVEVKGLMNAELVCELTPNEFEKMLHPENSARYIVYVVNNALAEAPQAPLPTVFEHRGGEKWVSQDGKKLKIRRKVGAVLTV